MKVLHIFGCLERGGAQMRTLELMPLMKAKGVHFDFCVLSDNESHLENLAVEMGAKVIRCYLKPGLLSFAHRFKKVLCEGEYDIVHSHVHYASGYILMIAAQAGVSRRIMHFRNTIDGRNDNLRRRIYRRILKYWANKYATRILAVCEGAMVCAWGEQWQCDPRAQVLYNGLNVSRYKRVGDERQKLLEELNLKEESQIIIHIGRFCRQKAHDVLIRSVESIIRTNPSIHLLLVGTGESQANIEEYCVQSKIDSNVHFMGIRSDVPDLLMGSDLFVLPSRWEGLPGTVLEAIAADITVVATDLPGVREIAQYTDLITVVEKENSHVLSQTIIRSLNSKCKRGAQGFPDVFSLEKCSEELFKIYNN